MVCASPATAFCAVGAAGAGATCSYTLSLERRERERSGLEVPGTCKLPTNTTRAHSVCVHISGLAAPAAQSAYLCCAVTGSISLGLRKRQLS